MIEIGRKVFTDHSVISVMEKDQRDLTSVEKEILEALEKKGFKPYKPPGEFDCYLIKKVTFLIFNLLFK